MNQNTRPFPSIFFTTLHHDLLFLLLLSFPLFPYSWKAWSKSLLYSDCNFLYFSWCELLFVTLALPYHLLTFLLSSLNLFEYQGLSAGLIRTVLFGTKALAISNSFSVHDSHVVSTSLLTKHSSQLADPTADLKLS